MNIAVFASAFFPHVGGVEELVRQLASEYRKKGMRPIILTNRWPRSLADEEVIEEIPVYRLPMRIPEGSLKAHLSYHLTHKRIRERMIEILKKHKIDLLHIQCVSTNGYYALLAKRRLGLPLVVTTQGERTMDAAGIYQKSRFFNHTLRALLAEGDYITACSQDTLDDMEQYWGQPLGQRASVIYNGICPDDFESGDGYRHARPYILGMGRLVPQKGFDLLLQAFAKANLESYDLLLAGEGPERPALEQLSHKLNISDKVRMVGRADRLKAVALFKGCSFFVLPSRLEPFGIVNLEAMAAGKAIAASRVGGVPEIVVDGQNGLLFPAEDIGALASALKTLATDHKLRQCLGETGRNRVQDFKWSAIAAQYERIYLEALN